MITKFYEIHIYYFRFRLLIDERVKHFTVFNFFRNYFQSVQDKIHILLKKQI